MQDCIFCKIIDGDIPNYTVYEDENILAFLDINPQSSGHSLVTIKKHVKNLSDLTDEDLLTVLKSVSKVSALLEEKLQADGITIMENKGIVQDVAHVHVHVIPRYKDINSHPILNSKNKEDFSQIINLINN